MDNIIYSIKDIKDNLVAIYLCLFAAHISIKELIKFYKSINELVKLYKKVKKKFKKLYKKIRKKFKKLRKYSKKQYK